MHKALVCQNLICLPVCVFLIDVDFHVTAVENDVFVGHLICSRQITQLVFPVRGDRNKNREREEGLHNFNGGGICLWGQGST